MRELARIWSIRIGALAVAIAAIVAACRNDVPEPTLPFPTREVSPLGPRPGPITPAPMRVDSDAGIPIPAQPVPAAARKARALRVAEAPGDAGVADVIDLPPVPDANVPIVRDAAQPLR
jgi:hypothetical protein